LPERRIEFLRRLPAGFDLNQQELDVNGLPNAGNEARSKSKYSGAFQRNFG
jgi:hypothetical protein